MWGSDLTRHAKLFIWQIIMHLMYNLARAQTLGHGDDTCPICPGQQETNEHIFFSCFKAQRGWAATAIFYEQQPLDNTLNDARSIIDIIDGSLQKSVVGTARLFVIYHTCWEPWNQRNDRVYNNKHPLFSARATAELAREHIIVAACYSQS